MSNAFEIAMEMGEARTKKELMQIVSYLDEEEIDQVDDVLRSVFLFTGLSVDTVRNPSGFDDARATPAFAEFFGGTFWEMLLYEVDWPTDEEWVPDTADYTKANAVLKAGAQATSLGAPKELYRGISNLEPNVFLDLMRPGSSYSLGEIVSTTYVKSMAVQYIKGAGAYKILYVISNPQGKGFKVDDISAFPHEAEVIVGGNITVDKVEFMGKVTHEEVIKTVTHLENKGMRKKAAMAIVHCTLQ